jgi:F-type H+-transporting ATPase subunit epsilon
MADKLHFSLVSPAKELFSGEVDHVIAPGSDGEFGVLAHHAPFMTTLRNGVVRVLEGDTVKMRIFVRGGFADITSAGLTILAEEARMLDDVKTEDVQAEMEATLLKIQSLDKDDSNRSVTLQEHYDYLESLKAALVH